MKNLEKATINNASGLLEEVITNGKKSMYSLFSWFLSEAKLIDNTIKDLNAMIEDMEKE